MPASDRRERPIHLNTAGAGLPAPGVREAMTRHLELEAEIGPYEAEEQRDPDLTTTVYARIAQLIGAHPDEIALFGSATDAWCRIVCQLRIPGGSRIWLTRYEYAGNLIALQRLASVRRCTLEVIPCLPDGNLDLDWVRGQLDERVALVSVVHMPSGAGVVLPVAALGELLAGSAAVYVVDACQTVGQLPVDVGVIGCHALTAAGRKFLRGPRGTGFAYLRRDLWDRIEPWLYDLHVADATSLTTYRLGTETAARFETAERGNAAVLGLLAAVEHAVTGPGGPSGDVSEALRRTLDNAPGVRVLAPSRAAAAITSFVHDRVSPQRLRAALRADGITGWVAHAQHTPLYLPAQRVDDFIRLSVHHYNTVEHVDALARTLHAL